MKPLAIQIIITVGAILVAVAHHLIPGWSIDKWTMYCLAIAILPWLAPLFKSVELPGVKVEFQRLLRAEEQAEKAGLLSEPADRSDYSFQVIAEQDPNLALAGLRIEIEKRLILLAQEHDIGTNHVGVARLLRYLGERNIITHEERSVLSDMVGMLNSAVHGAEVDNRAAQWAIEVGPRLLSGLDNKIT